MALILYVALVSCFRDYSGGGTNRGPAPLVPKLLIGLFLPGIPIFAAAFATQLFLTPSRFFTETPRGRRIQALSGVATPGQLKGVAFAILSAVAGYFWYMYFVLSTNWAFVNPFAAAS